jgi:hypothetical protein
MLNVCPGKSAEQQKKSEYFDAVFHENEFLGKKTSSDCPVFLVGSHSEIQLLMNTKI